METLDAMMCICVSSGPPPPPLPPPTQIFFSFTPKRWVFDLINADSGFSPIWRLNMIVFFFCYMPRWGLVFFGDLADAG